MSSQTVDLEALGRELGEAIADSPEHEAFEEARDAVEADAEAQERIEEFERLRQEFAVARERGDATEADLREVERAQRELHALPVMADYLDAQERLTDRLTAINEAVSEPLAVDFGGEAGGCCHD
ncbi:MAG: YlbF family regulator [Haloferacaceae archaeon]